MREVEFGPGYGRSEGTVVHVVWLTSGLGCDGDTVAMTSATSPSLEDLWRGVMPGMPRLAIYNSMLAYESGDEFMAAFRAAAVGRLDPFILVLEGSVPNEHLSGEGSWAAFGVDPVSGDPIPTCTWIDRLAPRAEVVLALGTCAAYGGIPAMRGNPTGAMGLRDYLGARWTARTGLPVVNLPGCPVGPDSITETLLHLALHVVGVEAAIDLDEQGRPRWLFDRTVQEGCTRAGYAEQGEFAGSLDDSTGCLVRLGCKGPVAKCNVPLRGWAGGVGGCPNVGGICIACTMPGFPDRFQPFMDATLPGRIQARTRQFTYGPILGAMRRRAIRRDYDRVPAWRAPGGEPAAGRQRR